MDEQRLYPWMRKREDSEGLMGKCVADRRNACKGKDDRAEQIDSGDNTLRLKSRNERLLRILREMRRVRPFG
jgi:hypothetical protein